MQKTCVFPEEGISELFTKLMMRKRLGCIIDWGVERKRLSLMTETLSVTVGVRSTCRGKSCMGGFGG